MHTTHCAEVRGIQIYDRSLELVLARDALTRSTRAGSTFEHHTLCLAGWSWSWSCVREKNYYLSGGWMLELERCEREIL